MKKQPTVLWIHGANQSKHSFKYLSLKCGFKNQRFLSYSSTKSFFSNLNNMINELTNSGPYFLVGHSLGGLYALYLSEKVKSLGGVSISTPFSGSFGADILKFFFPTYQLFRDVGIFSKPILDSQKIKLKIPWTQIVSVAGSMPYHESKNDGVITISSMTRRNDMQYIKVNHTHYEVMFSDTVAEIIYNQYQNIC